MKKIYFFFLSFIVSLSLNLNAQCTSCTITISSADAANHIVSAGQTMCITSTGIATGLITITAGGTLCNQGTINSSNLWVQGGTFNNYGTTTTTDVLISSAGIFNNFGNATIDSLLVTQTNSTYTNNGTVTNIKFAVSSNASAINNGNITVDIMGDSACLAFNNYGNLTINYDFGNAYNSIFNNHGYMKIMRDFYNSYNSNFNVGNCMITVGRDWYNSAIVSALAGACGGFNIAASSLNSGTVGSSGGPVVDLCDAGHPALGIDAPGGTIASNTTYCTCTNNCVLVAGINEAAAQSNVLIQSIYPNPVANNLIIELKTNESELLQIEIVDMLGKKQILTTLKANVGENTTSVNVSNLAQGTYILKITDSHQLQATQMFNVVK